MTEESTVPSAAPPLTRRAILGAAAAALPTAAFAAPPVLECFAPDDPEAFIRAMSILHPNGGRVAEHALRAGLRPSDLFTVILGFSDNIAHYRPALIFWTNNRGRTFTPQGEVDRGA